MKDLSSVVKVHMREEPHLSYFFMSILPTKKRDLGADDNMLVHRDVPTGGQGASRPTISSNLQESWSKGSHPG